MLSLQERNARQRIKRKLDGNADTLKYERTKGGKLMRIYRNMLSRITGVQKKKAHLYEGKCLLPKSEFYEWAMRSPEFHRLFADWERSGYQRKLAPSVDRIFSSMGYSLENMEWVTHSENSRRGSASRHSKRYPERNWEHLA